MLRRLRFHAQGQTTTIAGFIVPRINQSDRIYSEYSIHIQRLVSRGTGSSLLRLSSDISTLGSVFIVGYILSVSN